MLIPYPFPLRPNLTITIELPDNLTDREVERLQRFIGTLGWPDPGSHTTVEEMADGKKSVWLRHDCHEIAHVDGEDRG